MNKVVFLVLCLGLSSIAMAPVMAAGVGEWLVDLSVPMRLVAGAAMLLWAFPVFILGDKYRLRAHRWLAGRWPRLGPVIYRPMFRSAAAMQADGAP